MDFLETSIRSALAGPANYLPYAFDGDWTEADRATVEASIKPHVPERVDSMFNNWLFWIYADGTFGAKRSTWNMGMFYAETAQGMAEKITAYYSR
jgi:hypothetical protein